MGTEIIYIDEFKMSTNKSNLYGWRSKGAKGYVRLSIDQFSMNFIAVVLEIKIYGVMEVDGSVNAEILIHFLKKLCKARSIGVNNRQTPFIIRLDNTPLHTAAAVEDFAKRQIWNSWQLHHTAWCWILERSWFKFWRES